MFGPTPSLTGSLFKRPLPPPGTQGLACIELGRGAFPTAMDADVWLFWTTQQGRGGGKPTWSRPVKTTAEFTADVDVGTLPIRAASPECLNAAATSLEGKGGHRINPNSRLMRAIYGTTLRGRARKASAAATGTRSANISTGSELEMLISELPLKQAMDNGTVTTEDDG